ncbi:MAG: tetratricopeptide repeat protein [gamma proteobacterium symbiont of Phacoides pectinatus]
MRLLNPLLPMLCVALLAGCASTRGPVPARDEAREAETTPVPPFAEPAPRAEALDAEIVYNTLVGEIAIQRGELMVSYEHQILVAEAVGDPRAAERAARLALLMKEPALAWEAVEQWVALAPNDLAARQLAAMLAQREGAEDVALEHLEAIVRIGEAAGEDGFLHAMSALGREHGANDGALSLMRRLMERYPEDPRASYALALGAMIGKDYPLALEYAHALVAKHPGWVRGRLLVSRIHVAREEKAEATEFLRRSVDQYPDQPLLRTAYARLLLDARRTRDAYAQFLRLRDLTPGEADVHFSLGMIALELERYADAEEHLLAMRELDDGSEKSAYYLGRVAELRDMPQEAIGWYRKVRQGGLVYEAQTRSAWLMARQGELAVARDWLQGLRIRVPKRSVELYLLETEMLKEHGSESEVMILFERALLAHEAEPDLLYARALYAIGQGHLQVLEEDLRRVLADDPQNADALNALGYTLADQTDRYQEALELITRALELKPDSAAVLDSMGWVQYRLGNHAQALDYLRRAMEMLPDAEIAAHLGEVLWVTGARDEARRVWDGALEQDPQSVHILETRQRLEP